MASEKLIRLFMPLLADQVPRTRRRARSRLVDDLSAVGFVTRNVVVDDVSAAINLQVLDVEAACELLAGEAIRFLLASRISLARSKQAQAGNVAWQAIEHYYAAYYAVHFLLRLAGRSVSNLDNKVKDAVIRNDIAGCFKSIAIPVGVYKLAFKPGTDELALSKSLKKSAGGSHQDAWSMWFDLTSELEKACNNDVMEYSSTAIVLLQHKRFLQISTGKFRPPQVRAEINYQFKGCTWQFEQTPSARVRRIQDSIDRTTLFSIETGHTPEALITNNSLIIDFACELFKYLVERYERSVFRYFANKYDNLFTA
jgi:hypothetical protein